MLFAELRPSMFAPGRFKTFHELTRYIRSLATLVTPDPNTMLRVGRLRDAKWQRPADVRGADEKPRMMSFSDAIQIASALWVKEAGGVADLKFLMFDEWSRNEAKGEARLSLLHLQDYAEDARANFDVMAAVRLTRVQPLRQARSVPQTAPAGQEFEHSLLRERRPLQTRKLGPRRSQPDINLRTPVQRSYPRASGDSLGRTAPRALARSRLWRRPCPL